VNNCVGQNNQKHFILFLCYTLTISVYALVMLAMRAVSTVSQMEHIGQRNRPGMLCYVMVPPLHTHQRRKQLGVVASCDIPPRYYLIDSVRPVGS
jgi:hypothetical protein